MSLSAASCARPPEPMSTDAPFASPQVAPLADAVARDDGAEVRRQLASGIAADTPGSDGTTLLQWAAKGGKLEAAEALLDAGADPNRPASKGTAAVHVAAFSGNGEMLALLLARGGDPDATNATTGETPLVRAILGGHPQQVRRLLDAGADPSRADRNGATPLHAAASVNDGATVLALLEAGAPATAENSRGDTFQPYYFQLPDARLHERARGERARVVAWLKAHGVPLEREAGAAGRDGSGTP